MNSNFYIYIISMALVTYLIRAVPFTLFRKKIDNQFIQSFLYYIPYAVLSAMIIPDIFYSTDNFLSALAGFLIACVFAYMGKSLLVVAIASCVAVFLCNLIV